MTNRYPGTCTVCRTRVAKGDGVIERKGRRWTVKHESCFHAQQTASAEDAWARAITRPRGDGLSRLYIPSSDTLLTQNAKGRCEDAPCCGCCTF